MRELGLTFNADDWSLQFVSFTLKFHKTLTTPREYFRALILYTDDALSCLINERNKNLYNV